MQLIFIVLGSSSNIRVNDLTQGHALVIIGDQTEGDRLDAILVVSNVHSKIVLF